MYAYRYASTVKEDHPYMNKIIAILLAVALLAGMGLSALAEDVASDDMEVVETEEVEAEDTAEEAADESAEPAGDGEEAPAGDGTEEAEEADAEGEAAEEEEPGAQAVSEYAGTWYGEAYGMPLELNLAEQSLYTLAVIGKGESRNGRWEEDGELIYLDRGAENRIVFHASDEMLTADINGIEVTLTRERPDVFDGQTLKAEVVMADFEGQWVCTRLGTDGMIVDAAPEGGDSPLALNIAGETIVIAGEDASEAPISTQATYGNGVMTLDLGGTMTCLIQALENGMLKMDVGTGEGGTMTYYLEREEVSEEETEEAPEEETEEETEEAPGEETEEAPEEETGEEPAGEAAPEPAAEPTPEPTAEPATASTPEGRITSVIETRVKSKLSFTAIDGITVEPDGDDYTASVNLTWEQQNPGDTAKTVLSKFSADLAAYVGQRCPEVSAVGVTWTVPSLNNATAKMSFTRGADGMEEGASEWDSAF